MSAIMIGLLVVLAPGAVLAVIALGLARDFPESQLDADLWRKDE